MGLEVQRPRLVFLDVAATPVSISRRGATADSTMSTTCFSRGSEAVFSFDFSFMRWLGKCLIRRGQGLGRFHTGAVRMHEVAENH